MILYFSLRLLRKGYDMINYCIKHMIEYTILLLDQYERPAFSQRNLFQKHVVDE
jgi:hypothetical protein